MPQNFCIHVFVKHLFACILAFGDPAFYWDPGHPFASSLGQCVDRCRRYRGYGGVDVSVTPRLRMGLNAAAANTARLCC